MDTERYNNSTKDAHHDDPLFILTCLTTVLMVGMIADLMRDLSGRNE